MGKIGENNMKTVKYFTAVWCGPCKSFKPVMEELSREGYSIEFIDVDENQTMAQSMNVRSVPTTIIEENGIEVERLVGVQSKEVVKSKLA